MTEQMTTVAPEDTGNAQPTVGETTNATTPFDFNGALSAEFRDNPSITKFGGDVNKLSKSYLELQSLMGQSKVAIPKDDNDTVAWGMYDKAFGIPESADKYDLKAPDGVNLEEFKAIMKANHIAPSVAQKLLEAHLGDFEQYKEAIAQQEQAEQQQCEKDLKQEWGLAYTEKMQLAAKVLKNMSSTEEEYKYFLSKIGNDTRFIKVLARMGEAVSEGTLGGMEGQVSGFTKTPAEAKQEFDRIMSDPDDAYFAGIRNKRNDPRWCKEHGQSYVSEQERKERVSYVQSLTQMMG